MERQVKNRNRNKILLALDIPMLLAWVVATSPQLGGIAIHEWLGIACGLLVLAHLLLNWDWIAAAVRRLFRPNNLQTRVGTLLNVLLFIDAVVIIFSGLAISRVAVPGLASALALGGAWRPLHEQATRIFLLLVGLHLALHWSWLVRTVKRMLPAHHAAQPAPEVRS